MKLKKSALTIATILTLSVGLMACRQNTNPPAPGNDNRNGTSLNGTGQDRSGVNLNDGKGTNLMGIGPDGTTVQDNTNPNLTRNDRLNTTVGDNFNYDNQRSDRIERAVNSVPGVRGAKVLISNNRALVGVDMPAGTEGNATTTLRNNIERAVKSADNSITNVAVSADPDIFRRITNVGDGIRGGRPFSQFGAEVEEIFNRVFPR